MSEPTPEEGSARKQRESPLPAEAVPGLDLGDSVRRWRCALAGGSLAVAVSLLDWQGPGIERPGPVSLILVLFSLLISQPVPRREPPGRWQAIGMALLTAGFLWPIVWAFSGAAEPEAAVLTLPYWVLGAGIVISGSRLARCDPWLAVSSIAFAGLLRLIIYAGLFPRLGPEAIWWGATFVWLAGVFASRAIPREQRPESLHVFAGVGWFLIILFALTLQEFRFPWKHLIGPDFRAAWLALERHPISGWGLGAFDRVMLEFAFRDPEAAPWSVKAVMKLVVDIGVVPFAFLTIGGLFVFASAWRRLPMTHGRAALLGLAGLWLIASLSIRRSPLIEMTLCAASLGGLLAGSPAAGAPSLSPRAWTWVRRLAISGTAVGLVLAAFLPMVIRAHWESQNPRTNREAVSLLPQWTEPLRHRAVLIRAESREMTAYTDPRDHLRKVVDQWLWASPHEERAHVEAIRLAAKEGGGRQAEEAALEAFSRLPWSDVVALWAVRMQKDQGRGHQAAEFIELIRSRRGTLSTPLYRRLVEIRESEDAMAQEGGNGSGS